MLFSKLHPTAAAAAIALGICSASAIAQTTNRLGFTAGWNTSFIDRIGGNTVAGDCLVHFDDHDYQDWMLDPADPTGANFKFTGVTFVIQDQVANTPETFDVVAYHEDPANANFPDPAGPWVRTGAFTLPPVPVGYPNPAGPIAWIYTLTLTTPAAPKGDKWIGLGLPQPLVGNWPNDGLAPHTAFDVPIGNTGTTTVDLPGRGILGMTVPNISCFMPTTGGVPTSPASYPGGARGTHRQINIDVIANATGGVCVAQTSQTRYPSSAPVPTTLVPLGGTTNMLSGNNPDVFDVNGSTPPRADDIGFLVTDVNFSNAPVFMLRAFGPSPVGSIPVSVIGSIALPTSTGNICIDFINAELSIGFLDATGRFQHMEPLTPAVRALVSTFAPFDVWYQGFVANIAAGVGPFELHGTGCGVQHL